MTRWPQHGGPGTNNAHRLITSFSSGLGIVPLGVGGEAVAPHGKGASPVPVPTAVVAIAYAAESSPKSDNVHPCQPGDLFYERYV